MTKHLYILTGASRGLGRCLAEQLLGANPVMLCISRQRNTALDKAAQAQGCDVLQWQADLADAAPVADRLARWLAQQNPADFNAATLINNAGLMPPVLPLRAAEAAGLTQALRVGLEAPLLLSAAFLSATGHWAVPRKVLNISSGLGRRAMASQSAYCAAKAGLDHFTRCLALDEARLPQGAKVCSLAPGVIDTDMQSQLRQASPLDFPDHAGFAQLKASGQLTSAHEAACRVLAYLNRPDFGHEPVADVRH